MASKKFDDVDPTETFTGALEPSSSPQEWHHPYRSCAPKDRALYILQALLAGGGFLIPAEEAPPRTAERLIAITEEIVKQAQVKGWIEADPVAPAK